MTKTLVSIAFFLFAISTFAQKDNKNQLVDEIMLKIPDSSTYTSHDIASYINLKFRNQKRKVRAAFFWVTQHIVYNYSDRYNYSFDAESPKGTIRTLSLRKGVCEDYANLLKEILDATGIKTYVITGYTRNGKQINYNPHAWCLSLIDSTWYFTDPTFGAGFVANEQFVKKRNDKYFMVLPQKFIKHHIPFDPMWQLFNQPITKKDFVNGRTKPLDKTPYFNFEDTLKVFEKLSKLEKHKSIYNRTKANGIESYLDYDILIHYKDRIDNLLKRSAEKEFSIALDNYNSAILFLNEYINYKNNYFKPYQSDEAIVQMLNLIEEKLKLSRNQLDSIKGSDQILIQYITNQKELVDQNLTEIKKKKKDLGKYLEVAKQYRERLSMQQKNNGE